MAAPAEDPGQLARILLAHEKARARAWTEKNIPALEVLFAPDYVEINALGRFTKKDVLVSLVPTVDLHEFIIADPQLAIASPDAAIFTYRCIEAITARGERMSGTFHVAAHYTRRENKWLLLAWQITPFAG